MRLICTLALASLLASCALPPPPVATVVEDEPIKPTVVKKTGSQPVATETATLPAGHQRSLMKTNPDMITRLPDGKDFQPTAPPQTTADRGPNLMVPAPKPPPSE